MAMQQNSSVMITDTALPFWFHTIQIKRVPEDILTRHCIIIIIIIIIITTMLLLLSLVAGVFSLILLLNQRRPSTAQFSSVRLQYLTYV